MIDNSDDGALPLTQRGQERCHAVEFTKSDTVRIHAAHASEPLSARRLNVTARACVRARAGLHAATFTVNERRLKLHFWDRRHY